MRIMENFETINAIEVYEVDGKECNGLRSDKPKIRILNHWNRKCFIDVEIGDKTYTILADQLKRAIDNAQNAHSY